MATATAAAIDRLRDLCMRLPEATERPSHGESAWFVQGKKMFAMTADHHHDDRLGFWCAAAPGETEALVATDPQRFFVPPYVGHRGWLGVYLDVDAVNWDEIGELIGDAYRCVAPNRLIAAMPTDPARERTEPDDG